MIWKRRTNSQLQDHQVHFQALNILHACTAYPAPCRTCQVTVTPAQPCSAMARVSLKSRVNKIAHKFVHLMAQFGLETYGWQLEVNVNMVFAQNSSTLLLKRVPYTFFVKRDRGFFFLVKRDLSFYLFVIRDRPSPDNFYVRVKAVLELSVTRERTFELNVIRELFNCFV